MSFIGGIYTLQVSLVDVATGIVEFTGSESVRQASRVREAARALADRITAE